MKNQQLRIDSKIENLTRIEALVDDICELYHVNEDYYGNILVAVTEAVNNAIQHGNKFDPDKSIDLEFIPYDKHITFTIKDQGDGFDYENLPDPTDPENIEKPHGRGIFLMKHLADSLEFKEQGRIVALDFNVSAN